MNDPIASIDAENIDRNANEAYKTMHKAIKQFQDFESKQKQTGLTYTILTFKKTNNQIKKQ